MTDGVFRPVPRAALRSATRLGDVLVIMAAFFFALASAGLVHGTADLSTFLSLRISIGNLFTVVVFAALWTTTLEAFGLYKRGPGRRHPVRTLIAATKAAAFATALLATGALILEFGAVTRIFLLTFFGVSLLGTLLVRLVIGLALGEVGGRNENQLRRLLMVGCGPRGAALGARIRSRPELGYRLLGYADDIPAPINPQSGQRERLLGSLNELDRIVEANQIDEILVALPVKSQYESIASILALAEELGIPVRMPADFFRLEVARADVDYLDATPIMTLQTPRPSLGGLVIKRAFDIMVAAVALVVLAPLLLALAVAIRLDSRGPVLFRQERIGLARRAFWIYKFRTMVVDAEQQLAALEAQNEVEGAAFKMAVDPRVTRVGRFLRKFSLDELPQLWNVLIGDMSLVGPRPLPARDVDRFNERWQKRRFSVKPGLTCIWQANGRHDIGFEEWMEMDLQYIDQWSFGLDLEIMLKTVPAVLRGTGAS